MRATLSDAIGHALNDLGVEVVTHVPGYGATEAYESYNRVTMKKPHISFNEEVAYTIAHGASIAGKRSAVLFKTHGLTKATNSVIDSLYTNNTAGFVLILFIDRTGTHSDNILEIEPVLSGLSLPCTYGNPDTIYNDVINCYHESEDRKIPCVLLVDSVLAGNEIEFERNENLKREFKYKRDPLLHNVLPYFADYQFKLFTAKRLQGNIAAITRPVLPVFPDNLPPGIKAAAQRYIPFFDILREHCGDFITGDTGVSSSFALPPYEMFNIITYMGGSIPLAIGAYLAGYKNVWAVTGDFSFIAAGIMGLVEAASRELPIKIVILNNKQAAATGGQIVNKKTMVRALAGYENHIKHIYDLNNPFEVIDIIKEAETADQLRIIVVDC